MLGGAMRETMGDDVPDDDVAGDGSPPLTETETETGAGAAIARAWWRNRRSGRTLVVALVVAIAFVAIGLQVHVASERHAASRREDAQQRAEADERAARSRLETVDARVVIAKADEDAARAELARARSDMVDQGLDEPSLDETRRQTAKQVKELRAQTATVAKAIAEQQRLQPVAGSCLFELMRTLGRVSGGHDGGSSPACTTVAGHTPGPR